MYKYLLLQDINGKKYRALYNAINNNNFTICYNNTAARHGKYAFWVENFTFSIQPPEVLKNSIKQVLQDLTGIPAGAWVEIL